MNLKLLVQSRNKLNANKAIKFIESQKDAKLAIVHSSIKDEVLFLDFFDTLVCELKKVPFVGMRVSGTATKDEGYTEDSVAIAVLCGNFEVKIFHEQINYEEPEETAKSVISQLWDEKWDLCLVYSSTHYKQNTKVDSILRRVQIRYPNLQILGGASSPPPIVVTNEGINKDRLVVITIKDVKFDFRIDSGFKFKKDGDKFTVTKADETYIYEIDEKNAAEEYSKMQHLRPYFLNMLTDYLLTRSDLPKIAESLSKVSTTLYRGLVGIGLNLFGVRIDKRVIEPLLVLELNEGDGHLLTTSYKSRGTELKRVETSKNEQLEIYERLQEKFPKSLSMLIISCAANPYWFNFDFKSLERKIKKIRCPFMVSFVFGEFGTYLPYKNIEQNVVHGGTVKALIFK